MQLKLKFQTKLLLAFCGLIISIIFPLHHFVNSTIDSLSDEKIEENLSTSQKVFESFLNARRRAWEQSLRTVLASQASLRAILATTTSESDDLFGASTTSKASRKEANEIIFSSIESLDFYRENPIVIFVDANGIVLFNKSKRGEFETNLTDIPGIKSALEGQEAIGFWLSTDNALRKLSVLPPSDKPMTYEVLIKPLIFGDSSVKGLMLVGAPMSNETLREIKEITNTEIAILSEEEQFSSTHPIKIEYAALNEGTSKFQRNGEDFIGRTNWLENHDGKRVAATLVFRSKTRELSFYRDLKSFVTFLAALGVAIAVVISLAMSSAVTAAIRILIKGVDEIRKGNLDHVLKVQSGDEFQEFASTFNQMTKEMKEKEQIKKTFKKYVHPRIANALMEDSNKVRLGGTKNDMVFFFSDIAGFTTISEEILPEQVVEFLNQYLSKMAGIIDKCEGIVDKYIGDAIMAYWILSGEKQRHLELACLSAVRQRNSIKELKKSWSGIDALARFDVRMGLHAGEATLGNIGSEERMDYTAIGDNVNSTARLEALNKEYDTSILASEDVAQPMKEKFLFRELDWVLLAGKSKPVRIFELLCAQSEVQPGQRELCERFKSFLDIYRTGNFTAALLAIREIEKSFPSDLPTKVFLERCEELTQHPPAHWKGIYKSRGKEH